MRTTLSSGELAREGMSKATVSNVFMAGSGFMGSAIAYLIATKTNASVTLFDISAQSLKKAEAALDKFGKSSIDKGFISAEVLTDSRSRIKTTTDHNDAVLGRFSD